MIERLAGEGMNPWRLLQGNATVREREILGCNSRQGPGYVRNTISGRHFGEITIYPDERIEDKANGHPR